MFLNIIKWLLVCLFFSSNLFADIYVERVGPGFVDFTGSVSKYHKEKLYRDGRLLKTFLAGTTKFSDKGTSNKTYTYTIEYYYLNKDNEWQFGYSDTKEVDAGLLWGNFESELTIGGVWRVDYLNLYANTTIQNATLKPNNVDHGIAIDMENSSLLTINNSNIESIKLSAPSEQKPKVDITNSTFSKINNFSIPVRNFSNNRGKIRELYFPDIKTFNNNILEVTFFHLETENLLFKNNKINYSNNFNIDVKSKATIENSTIYKISEDARTSVIKGSSSFTEIILTDNNISNSMSINKSNISIKNNDMTRLDIVDVLAGEISKNRMPKNFILLNKSNNIQIKENIAKGISLKDSNSTLIFKNKVEYITLVGNICSSKIYNNMIENIDTASKFTCEDKNKKNIWNIDKTLGVNIVGGPYLGGNFWKGFGDQPIDRTIPRVVDSDGDGLYDSPYIDITYRGNEIKDNLPLVKSKYTIALLKDYTYWKSALREILVLPFKFVNSSISDGDVHIDSLKFNFDGSNDTSYHDIDKVILFDDPTCTVDDSASILGTNSKWNSDGTTNFSIDIDIKQGDKHCFYLKYKVKKKEDNTLCPCRLYGAKLKPENIAMTVAGKTNEKVGGNSIVGRVNIGWPTLEHINQESSMRLVEKNEEIKSPLQIKLVDSKSECQKDWKVEFTITQAPNGATGYKLKSAKDEGKKILVNVDNNNIASIGFVAGDKAGSYIITATPEPQISNCPMRPTDPPNFFTVFVGGIDVKAQLDGSGSEKDALFSTFITTIEAKNRFTATPILPSWYGEDELKEVKFTPSWSSEVSDNTKPFEAEFDMANLSSNSLLTVTVIMNDDTKFSEIYNLDAIVLPNWISTFNGSPYQGIRWEFVPNLKEYKLQFNFPDDFVWKNPIPDNIALIGGEENEEGLSIEASAFYNIDRSSNFNASGEFAGKLFGKEIEVKGSMRTDFDEQFNVKAKPAPYADLSAKTDFDLGSKTLASKTITVYGVPVTVAVDIGGNVQIFAEGKLIFSKKLKIDKAIFIPTSTITITIDASASAVFGLVKAGVRTEPAGTVKIKLSYTTETAEVKQEQFGGVFELPVTIYGSLFWGAISGDLGSTEFGPWKFGDSVSMKTPQRLRTNKPSSGKRFYSTSAIATSSSGDTIRVYTIDEGDSSSINPEISSSKGDITSNNLWEIDPDVTFLDGSSALAIWTSNKGDKTLNKLNDILNHQDIAVSIYNGTSWSTPQSLISDKYADGNAKVAYNSTSSKAMALWVHNSIDTMDGIQSKKGFELYFNIYNANSNSWGTTSVLNSTKDSSADFMPMVSSLNDGRFMAVWVRDSDGELFSKLSSMKGGSDIDKTNTDCNIVYAIYDTATNSWSDIKNITTKNGTTELMPTVASSSKHTVAVWIEKGLNNLQNLYMSEYKSNGWTLPILVDSASYVMEDPSVIIKENQAHIVYRRMNGGEEGLYEIIKPLDAGVGTRTRKLFSKESTKPKKLATGTIMWSSVAINNLGNMELSWTNPNRTKTLSNAVINATPNATLGSTSTIAIEEVDKRFKYLQLKQSVTVENSGIYSLSATLISPSGNIVESVTVSKTSLDAGEKELTLNFNGSKISATKESGNYVIKDITLLEYTPDEVVIDTIDSVNINFSTSTFILPPLRVDSNSYSQGKSMKIDIVNPTDTTVSVTISSSDGGEESITLDKNGENYSKVVELESSGLVLESGSLIIVKYIDQDKNIWQESAIWIEEAQPDYTLNIPLGWSMLSPPVGEKTKIESIFKDANIVWGYDNGSWRAWSSDATTRASLKKGGTLPLTEIQPTKGYYVKSDSAQSIEMFSSKWSLSSIALKSGWNLVGFAEDTSAQELFKLHNKVDRIWCLEGSSWRGISRDSAVNRIITNKGYETVTNIDRAEACFVHQK